MNEGLEQLTQKRTKWVEASQENDFEEGIKLFLSDLYPDNAHFIYELLQNAEDAGATEVRFTLFAEKIEFKHNGIRLFTITDVDGITSIGKSPKRGDFNNIGKFGVGFKAVFTYTNTPEIHSGGYHFAIRDLVIPEKIEIDHLQIGEKDTLFSFPFDNNNKSAQNAVKEISRGLIGLSDNVLLFLNHIRKIDYSLPDGRRGSIERLEREDKITEIHVINPNILETISHWLRFEKSVKISNEEENQKNCHIAVAYRLEQKASNDSPEWKVIPINGRVSIYFPAEKEDCCLKFHINAPFGSTVARDSIKDCEGNKELRDHLAQLIVESLTTIRDKRLLTVDFLAVMPNNKDDLPEFYRPIREKIIKTFQEKELTPTRNKSHAAAKLLYRGPVSISDVLNDDGLALFAQEPSALWVANPPQINQREDDFLNSLQISVWDGKCLFRELCSINWENKTPFKDWLRHKDDTWMMHFYAMLNTEWNRHTFEYFTYNRYLSIFPNLAIVRVGTKQGDKLVYPKDAQFLPDEDFPLPPTIFFVKKEVYSNGKSDTIKISARHFLKTIGVKDFNIQAAKEKANEEKQQQKDVKAETELEVNYYKNPPASFDDRHYKDVNKFIAYWKTDPVTAKRIFKNLGFLVGMKNGSKVYWCKPPQLCLDSPYIETGLERLAKIHNKPLLWDGYQRIVDNSEDYIKFLKDLGIISKIELFEIVRCSGWRVSQKLRPLFKWTRTSQNESAIDYTIKDLPTILQYINLEKSWQLWQTIINADRNVAKASYRPNNKTRYETAESELVETLKKNAWIPDKSGVFHLPREMSVETLHDNFKYDDNNGLLTALGFGEVAKIKEAENDNLNSIARDLGFASLKDAKQAGKQWSKPKFPVRTPRDRERYLEKTDQRHTYAPGKKYTHRSRSVRSTRGYIDPGTWLAEQYTNDDDQMVCQICQHEMPFRKRDGNYYFEAVEVLTNECFTKEAEAQFLALCPVCAARFKEFVKQDNKSMDLLKHDLVNSEDLEIPLQLGDLSTSIRFVETHWLEIKNILSPRIYQ